jgi:hypothetical protein
LWLERGTVCSSADFRRVSYFVVNRLAIVPEVIIADRKSVASTMVELDMISNGVEEMNSPTNIMPKAIKSAAARIFCRDLCVLHPRNRLILVLSTAKGKPR